MTIIIEKDLFHGSGTKFNQFDHRKAGLSGAGSMCFGWGSYFAEDEVIAKSYADSLKKEVNKQTLQGAKEMFVNAENHLDYNCASFIYNTIETLENYINRGELPQSSFNTDYLINNLKWTMSVFDDYFYLSDNDAYRIPENIQEKTKKYKHFFGFTLVQNYDILNKYLFFIVYKRGSDIADFYYNRLKQYYEMYEHCLNYLIQYKDTDAKLQPGIISQTSYVYKVIVPDNNGTNYIDWYEEVPQEIRNKIVNAINQMYKNHSKFPKNKLAKLYYKYSKDKKDRIKNDQDWDYRRELITSYLNNDFGFTGHDLYWHICNISSNIAGNIYRDGDLRMRWASTFLRRCGIIGITYSSGTKWKKPDDAMETSKNYVIFDKNDIKIEKINQVDYNDFNYFNPSQRNSYKYAK